MRFLLRRSGCGVLLGPLAGGRDGGLLVLLPGLGDLGSERVIGVGRTEERLDGEEDGADLEGGGPVVCSGAQSLVSRCFFISSRLFVFGRFSPTGLLLYNFIGILCVYMGRKGGAKRGADANVLFRTSRQMRPSLSTLGWKILVRKRILGGTMG